jgi:hypothetical protein
MRKEHLWMVLLPCCIFLTQTAVDDVKTGIAGIASSHLLNRPTTPFWFGMIFCVSATFVMYVLFAIAVRSALRLHQSSGGGL